LLAIAPGPTRIIRSSMHLRWRGLLVEEHATSPGERASVLSDRTVISLNIGSVSRLEHRITSGHFVGCVNRPGSIMTTPAGPVPAMRLHTSSKFLHCALDQEFMRGVYEEGERSARPACVFRSGLEDKPIRSLLGMLRDQLETKEPMGSLFVDSLAHALAARYLSLEGGIDGGSQEDVSPLPSRILNRVREKIEAHLDTELSLESLAAESGYSRAHFLRMFRAATGKTPHQFVLDMRLSRAQKSLRQRNASIIDVAMACGFSSQSHMTNVFRQRLQVTPAQFRRKCVARAS